MVNRTWLLIAFVGSVLVYEATAISCVRCKDTEADKSCGRGATTTEPVPCDEGDVCYMRNNGGLVERGCLKEINSEGPSCVTTEGGSCMTCSVNLCNNNKWMECHQCEQTGGNCALEQQSTAATFCSLYVTQDQCYAKVDGTTVTRGCKSDLPTTGADGCTGNKLCDVCSEAGCNSLSSEQLTTFPKCLACTSAEANCVAGTSVAQECDKRDDVCFTRVQANVLERGCLSSLTVADQGKCSDDKDATCMTCSADTEGCNKQSWLKCHQCKETDAAACASAQVDANAQFCKTYKDANQCYERLESDKVVRGCASDLETNADPCKDNQECRPCTIDACNREVGTSLKTEDRCLQCTTKVDSDGNCLTGKAATYPCARASDKKCYARTDAAGVLTRGCQGDLTADEVQACTGKTCEVCEVGKCSEVFPTDRLRCYQCSGETDKDCTNQLTGEAKSSYCNVYKAEDKCYARIANNVFERGCQSNLEKAACDGLGERECTSCGTENCNAVSEERLKNSVGQMAVSSVVIAFAVAVNYLFL